MFSTGDHSHIMNMPRRKTLIGLAAVFLMLATCLFSATKRHLELVRCSNQMHGLLFVCTKDWPDAHAGVLPSDFRSLSNELGALRILICPGDHARHPAVSWDSVSSNNCSYEILAPAIHQSDTNVVFLRCKIHGLVGYADDRLQDASGKLIWPDRLW